MIWMECFCQMSKIPLRFRQNFVTSSRKSLSKHSLDLWWCWVYGLISESYFLVLTPVLCSRGHLSRKQMGKHQLSFVPSVFCKGQKDKASSTKIIEELKASYNKSDKSGENQNLHYTWKKKKLKIVCRSVKLLKFWKAINLLFNKNLNNEIILYRHRLLYYICLQLV